MRFNILTKNQKYSYIEMSFNMRDISMLSWTTKRFPEIVQKWHFYLSFVSVHLREH